MFNVIVAVSKNWVIGNGNKIPWKCTEDMKFFKRVTSFCMDKMKKNAVIMGFNTWKSLGRTGGLPNRMNVVIDRDAHTVCVDDQGVVYANTLNDALDYTNTDEDVESVYVIGGGKIYEEALKHSGLDKVLLTKINRKYEGDVKFPRLKSEFELEKVKKGVDEDLEFRTYKRATGKHEEYQYLDKIDEIMREGEVCSDRTGVGIKSCWGAQMTYDIGKHFPLLTTKRTFLRVITEELLWFLRGSTNNKELKEKNVHIWDGNTTREYLDSIGLTDREEDDGGPIYGFNFRHFGAEYVDCHTDYTGQGVDQVAEALRLIREKPDSRRILISLWNPSTLKDACLPPCFVEDTNVLTNEGYKCIQDIEEGDKLFTHLGNIQEVNKKYITPYTGIIHDIKIQYIPKISTTPNHPFFVREVEYKNNPKLVRLKCSDPHWVNAKDLNNKHYHGIKINDKSIIPEFTIEKGCNKYKTIKLTKKLDKKEEWFMMGYYLGDGWSRWDRKGTFYMVFNQNDESKLLEKFKKIVSTCHMKQRQKSCTVYEFHSYEWAYILKMFGRRAHNKKIPNWICDAPAEYIEEFIKGYKNADGCELFVNCNTSSVFTTTSRDIAFKLQLILLKIGIFSRITFSVKKKTCIIEGREVNQRNLYGITYINNRKRNVRSFIKDGYAWFPLIKNDTRNVSNINVYNFDVGDDHTYIVNNICTHNCHFVYHFRVYGDTLNCAMVQRSGDMGLGVPFNIASATMMTYIFAHLTGKKPGKLVHTIHDAHVYTNHEDALQKQLTRTPYPFPKMNIVDRGQTKVEDFRVEDFELLGYECYPTLKMDMAV